MQIFEIISAIALIVACVFIVIVVLMQDTKQNMSQAISGGADNFYQKNSGRSKDAKLNRTTVVATVVFFVLALVVNIINVHSNKEEEDTSSGIVAEDTSSDTSADADDGAIEVATSEAADDSTASDTSSDSSAADTGSSAADTSAAE